MATAEGTRANARRPLYRPWLQRAIEASGRPPWLAGIAIGVAQLALFFAWHAIGWGLGVRGPRERFFWEQMVGPNVINAILIGYAPAAMAWSRREAQSELTRLGPLLPRGGSELRERIARFPRGPMALAGATFGCVIVPLIVFDPTLNSY
ncbi:MAG: hypothetical protein ABFS41_04390, partial [Myxococcota bacterium]